MSICIGDLSQGLIERCGFCSIHLNLGHEWEFNPIFVGCEFTNFCMRSRFLGSKLIAGEANDGQIFMGGVQMLEGFVLGGSPAGACNVHHQPLAAAKVSK